MPWGAGRVLDSYSREMLYDVQVDLLTVDSVLISTCYTRKYGFSFNAPCNLRVDSIPGEGAILYLTKEGYYPVYATLPKAGEREYSIELRPIMMNRIPFYKPKELNEVTVTASRVKMVLKGDTIVYNADAFALAKGSMLDGLIDQLPGVELKSSGQIFVNGKFVSDLLVNGDSFFKGDPRIALENRPGGLPMPKPVTALPAGMSADCSR